MLPSFEAHRAILLDEPEPDPFAVTRYRLLVDALAENEIAAGEQFLVAPFGETAVLLPILAMVYHHVAQGSLHDKPWMASFCCLCNAGAIFNAQHQGQAFAFAAQGYYDVMVLISDHQTRSYWNHLTGECLYGPMAGAKLDRLNALQTMRAIDAVLLYPDAHIAIMDGMDAEATTTAHRWNDKYRLPTIPNYGDSLLSTKGQVDPRLPPSDMGLGIWTANTQRYYPIRKLYEAQNVIVDQIDGRSVVIILNTEIGLPTVFYFEPTMMKMLGSDLHLSPNARFRNGILFIDGKPVKPERPNHNTIRWYAFSAIAPGCEVYTASTEASPLRPAGTAS